MAIQNPFAAHRWETEAFHRIWIPPDAAIAASPKSCFISGLRGTGKTVLLNCLDPLKLRSEAYQFLNPEELPRGCLGVYINILSEFTNYFHFLAAASQGEAVDGLPSSPLQALSFQTYLIFHALGKATDSIDECQRAGILTYTPQQENAFVAEFLKVWHGYFGDCHVGGVTTLLGCGSLLLKQCMAIRVNSLRLYPDRVLSQIEGLDPIAFYHRFCEILANTGLLITPTGEYHVKICLDDVHRFARTDQMLLNAIVGVTMAPIGWNLSFVTGRYDPVTTSEATAPITSHDVEYIDLDYQNNPRAFRNLCSKIYHARIAPALPTGSIRDYDDNDYSAVLGRPNASVLFSHLMNQTESEKFKERILNQVDYVAERLSRISEFRGTKRGAGDPRHYLYHTYVFDVLFGGDSWRFDEFIRSRHPAQVNNYFRQKNVAALVCAANELGRVTPYAGTNVLTSLADGCVRDFLRILSAMFESVSPRGSKRGGRLASVFETRQGGAMGIDDQTRGFVEASRRYLDQFQLSNDRFGRTLAMIVFSLAELVRLLQSKDRMRALALPERGAVQLSFNESTLYPDQAERVSLLKQVLSTGQYIGIIRLVSGHLIPTHGRQDSETIVFRLHRLVAPGYNFSSRGPLRKVHVSLQSFLEFAEERGVEPEVWAEKVYNQVSDARAEEIGVPDEQASLFP